jgi:hypothetical protein
VTLAVATRATALGSVCHDDVGTLLDGGNEFQALVARIEGGGGLGRHDRQDLNPLHVLLDVGAIDVADHRAAVDQRDVQHALWQLGTGRAPRGNVAIEAGYFDVNAPRH